MSANRLDASRVADDSKHSFRVKASLQPLMLAMGSLVWISQLANAEASSLLWATNISPTAFAVDAQTNVCANAGGTVIKLSPSGIPLQTNAICPRPGLAARAANGSYYFTGILPSHIGPRLIWLEFDPQDFGVVTLSNSPVFLVEYSAAGTLLWATNFGPYLSLKGIAVNDVLLDSEGDILLSYTHFTSTVDHSPVAAKFKADGSQVWTVAVPKYGNGLSTAGVVMRVGRRIRWWFPCPKAG